MSCAMIVAVFPLSICVATIVWRSRLPCQHGIVGALLGFAVSFVAGLLLAFLRLADWHIVVGGAYIGLPLAASCRLPYRVHSGAAVKITPDMFQWPVRTTGVRRAYA